MIEIPAINPIEKCWAKIKERLRMAKARLVDALHQAVAAAIATITPQNSTAWFQHCGYRIHLPSNRSSAHEDPTWAFGYSL